MKKLFTIFMLLVLPFLYACERIESGNVGVVSVWGQVKPEVLGPGVYQSIAQTVHEYTGKQIVLSLNDLKATDKNNLVLSDFDVDVFYRVTPSETAKLVIKYRGDVGSFDGDYVAAHGRVLRSAREAAYTAAAKHKSLEMAQARPQIAKDIADLLQKDLDASDPGAFTVTDINIRALVPDPQLASTSRENAEMQNRITQKQQEIEMTKAQAQANEVLGRSLTPQLLELKRIEAISSCLKSGACTLIQGNATPLITVNK